MLIAHSQVSDGNMSFLYDDTETVIANRSHFLAKYDLTFKDCVAMRANHGTEIKRVDTADRGRGMSDFESGYPVDALVTTDPTITLFLLTADCVPVVIYDPVTHVLCLAHVSRKNTEREFAAKLIKHIQNMYGSKPEDISVYLGPHIHKESYESDLTGDNISQVESGGVPSRNITVSPLDTYSSPVYFSHHRAVQLGEKDGRFATIATINTQG